MGVHICRDSGGVLHVGSPCIREFWSAVLPLVLVGLTLASTLPQPKPVRALVATVKRPFRNFLTLPEAEALDGDDVDRVPTKNTPPVPLWRSLVLAVISLLETLVWLGLATYSLAITPIDIHHALVGFALSFVWLYAAVRPIVAPSATPPTALLALYTLQLVMSILVFGGILFDSSVRGYPNPAPWVLAGHVANLAAIVILLLVVFNMPLAIPSDRVEKDKIGTSISPEDYTTLWGWMSFTWILPLVERGTNTTLSESDIWSLSPTMQARPLYIKFSHTLRSTLLRRLWAANSLDLMLDFVLTYVSVVFNYASPFFLKRILDSLDPRSNPTPEKRALAYIYAVLAFLSTLCKAQADVQHLWFGRRAATRIRSELMAAIYDKALKRKDFSGLVDKDPKNAEVKASSKGDDPKAGADIGKIVNLMAGDANRISQVVTGSYFIYGAPFEIVIAATFLYQLLGLSAFAGFVVLIVGWPLNSIVSRRAVRIHKGVSSARDKRMGVLNELIGAMKFIKFFAWEEQWINRAMDAREVEMKWMVKARLNSVMFSLIWICAPILVSVTSFFVYVVQGNELTVGTAFTVSALMMHAQSSFTMLTIS